LEPTSLFTGKIEKFNEDVTSLLGNCKEAITEGLILRKFAEFVVNGSEKPLLNDPVYLNT